MARPGSDLFRAVAAVVAVTCAFWPDGSLAVEFEGQATTSVGGGTFDLNAFLGADRYYTNSTPINGQNTVSVNLEAGHIWNGHETLQHVTTFYNSADTFGAGAVAPLYDRHATWAAMFIGGRPTTNSPFVWQQGLAPGTDLRSAAIATGWSGTAYALSFGLGYLSTLIPAYDATFGTADVINSSFGGADPDGTDALAWLADAYSFVNPGTLYVVSAGNSGPAANTVLAPGSGYNVLTVGALGGANTFNSVASFSSRGPQDFGYFVSGNYVTVSNVRAAVDLSAPGENVVSAFYGGQTGGNNTNLTGSVDNGSDPGAYSGISGTSFAAPIVAGGAALVYSAAKTLPQLSTNAEATQSMVAKSLLLTGADKTSGWSNGQAVTNGVITTTQSLDWAVGAGRMNLDRTFGIQVQGQTGVAGQATGAQGEVRGTGWDFGASLDGINNDYTISDVLLGGATFTTSLSWMRSREYDPAGISLEENAQANLNLSLWSLGSDYSFQSKVAESVSLYNTVEHLSFALPSTGLYGLRVSYAGNTFDNTGTWGTGTNRQTYGLAWDGEVVATVYWNPSGTNNVWDGATADFNTGPGGSGSGTAATTTNTQVVFAGTNAPGTVVVSGSQGASGLVIEDGAFTFEGTNSASITVGSEGISNKATVTGTTTFGSSVGLIVVASQSWSNAAATGLAVEGQVTGNGNLTLHAASSGGIVLAGPVDHAGALTNSGTGSGTTTVSGAIGTNVTGVTQDSTTSTLVLAGTNAYTGQTTVAAGHLIVVGDNSASALTSVQSGGTLSGAGRAGDTMVLAGGTLSPGNSPGTLNIAGDIDWLGGGNYNWQMVDAAGTAGLSWDLVSVSGALDLSALTSSNEFKINLWSLSGVDPDVNGHANNFDPSRNYTWTIARALGGITGYTGADQFLVNIGPTNGTGGFANLLSDGTFSVLRSGNDLNLVFTSSTPIPEPGTWVAAALLAAGAGFMRWRKRRA